MCNPFHSATARVGAVVAILALVWPPLQGIAAEENNDADEIEIETRVSAEAVRSNTENTREITSDDIDEEQVRDWEDLVRYIPGVEVDNLGRFNTLGFNIRGMDADRVAITVDGISLSETFNPPTYAPYDFFATGRGGIDPAALKAVQIVKGADAVTAGSGALGGAVMFVTRDAADFLATEGNDTHFGARLGYTSASDETMGTLTAANRTGRLETLLVYTGRRGHETESFYSGSRPDIPGTAREIPDPLDYRNHNVLLKAHFHATPAQRLGLVVERYDANSELDQQTRLSSSYLTRTTDDRIKRQRYGIDYRWRTDYTVFDELEWRYDYQRSYNLGHTLMTIPSGCPEGHGSSAISPCHRTEDRDYEQLQHKTMLQLDKTLGNHWLSYGASFEQRDLDFSHVQTRYVGTTSEIGVGYPAQADELVPDTRARTYSLYLRDQFQWFDDRLLINIGGRYDRYDYSPSLGPQYEDDSGTVQDVSFSEFSGQLGANWRLGGGHSVWFQLGRGFRAPRVEDLYFFPSTTTATEVASGETVELWSRVANPELKAETSRTLELGQRWQGTRFMVGASVFHNRFNNFIEQTTRIRNPEVEYETCNFTGTQCDTVFGNEYTVVDNVGSATVEGVELEGQWFVTDDFDLRLAYAYSRGEDSDGRPLESIAPASALLGANYRAPSGRWSVGARLLHSTGKKLSDTDQAERSPFDGIPQDYFGSDNDYTMVDLYGGFNIIPNLRLNLAVNNLFNEEYIRWQRIRFINEGSASGGVRGGVSDDGINRYTEPGRNYRVTLDYRF